MRSGTEAADDDAWWSLLACCSLASGGPEALAAFAFVLIRRAKGSFGSCWWAHRSA